MDNVSEGNKSSWGDGTRVDGVSTLVCVQTLCRIRGKPIELVWEWKWRGM
jgi:hypothetical protein